MKKSETDGRRSLADLLAAADCRGRFLGILQSKLATNGIELNLDPEQAMVDENTDIHAILRSVSEALSRHLGFGEAVIALFRDLHLRSYMLATSAAQDSGAAPPLTKALEDVLARGYSPRLGDCIRIESDGEGGDQAPLRATGW